MGRNYCNQPPVVPLEISTHTLRVGRNLSGLIVKDTQSISTHTPRVGRNTTRLRTASEQNAFLLTRPEWGATLCFLPSAVQASDFYSHAPSGAQQYLTQVLYYVEKFLLTRPEWGATSPGGDGGRAPAISTHTPRVGRNAFVAYVFAAVMNFYSHAPSGAQRIMLLLIFLLIGFLLTRPEWGATSIRTVDDSITKFLLTRPEWGATVTHHAFEKAQKISTHTPRVGRNTADR